MKAWTLKHLAGIAACVSLMTSATAAHAGVLYSTDFNDTTGWELADAEAPDASFVTDGSVATLSSGLGDEWGYLRVKQVGAGHPLVDLDPLNGRLTIDITDIGSSDPSHTPTWMVGVVQWDDAGAWVGEQILRPAEGVPVASPGEFAFDFADYLFDANATKISFQFGMEGVRGDLVQTMSVDALTYATPEPGAAALVLLTTGGLLLRRHRRIS